MSTSARTMDAAYCRVLTKVLRKIGVRPLQGPTPIFLLHLADHPVGRELDASALLELVAVRVDVLDVAAGVHLDRQAVQAAGRAARCADRGLGLIGRGRAAAHG